MTAVDDATSWIRSSFCNSAQCLEVAVIDGAVVGVRDAKAMGNGPVLQFTSSGWSAFVSAIRNENLTPRVPG